MNQARISLDAPVLVPRILKAMTANGSPAPLFETDNDRAAYVIRLPVHPLAQVPTPEVRRVVMALQGEWSRQQLQQALNLKDDEHFRKAYLLPALDSGLIEMTLPEKPRSSKQRYRLTAQGQQWLAGDTRGGEP